MENLKSYIKKYLRDLGLPVNLIGYKYLTTAILYYIENEDKDISMKDIYKYLNKKHNVKMTKAERNIRYILENYNTKDLKINTNKKFIIFNSEIISEQYKSKVRGEI